MSNIADKIAKLIAKADSTTHPSEAELFMAKAHELLEAHGLSLMDLGELDSDPVGVDKDVLSTPSYPWIHRVASALVRYYGCRFVRHPVGPRMVYTVSGRASARITFTLMLPFVQRQIQKLSREAYKKGVYGSNATAANRIADATAARIWSMVPKMAQYEGTGANALVPVDLVQKALDDLYDGNIKAPRKSKLVVDAYAKEAAKNISLNAQTGKAPAAKRLESS